MRIAYIVPSLGPLGPVIVVRNLVERMVAHGHECVVYYFDERGDSMTFACETYRISFWHRVDLSGFDWVHAHSFRPMVYTARLRNVRKMTTMHSYLFTEYHYSLGKIFGYLLGRFTMFVANSFDKVVTLSQNAREYYSRWIPKAKLRVCYNGVRIDMPVNTETQETLDCDLKLINSFKMQSMLVATISELVPIKNLETMIQAISLLPEQYKLLIIGSGASRARLEQMVISYSLNSRVLFLGERVEAHRYLPQVDIFAMTSLSEGFCLSLVEAALYGKKIVCADIAGMREKFSDDEVTYFQPDSPRGLADAIVLAQAHGEKGQKAKIIAEERFATERMYEAYEKEYCSF